LPTIQSVISRSAKPTKAGATLPKSWMNRTSEKPARVAAACLLPKFRRQILIQIKGGSGLTGHPATSTPERKDYQSMRTVTTNFVGVVLATLTVSTGALAQSPYYDDLACRQYADAQIAPLRDQANAQSLGSTLLGAGLGAALGGAVGGGRGAGIGAASGAIVGTGVGAANAQNAAAYLQQQYNAYYAQCMSTRSAPPYGAPAPAYAPAPGYAPQPTYPPQAGWSGGSTANEFNRQELNRLQAAPPPPPYYPPPPRY
jgi:hypothetical protein